MSNDWANWVIDTRNTIDATRLSENLSFYSQYSTMSGEDLRRISEAYMQAYPQDRSGKNIKKNLQIEDWDE